MTSTNQSNVETVSPEQAEEFLEDAIASVSYSEEIETVLAGIADGRKVMVGESEGGRIWTFQYGSAEVFVQLTGKTDDDTLTVWSPVLQLPAKNEAQLMRKLLEMNWLSTFESHFAVANNQVVVLFSRSLVDITPAEISRAITIVATIADENDDQLQAEFGQ